jgi:hypothetical protein
MDMNYKALHEAHKEASLYGRYITLEHLEPLLAPYNPAVVGTSVQGRPIYRLDLGTGPVKVLLWSQMHGNESTTTKALFDFLHLLEANREVGASLLSRFTFCVLPLLNPDGAVAYTRVNANEVDLNRDAQELSQPESRVLRSVFEAFGPNYCYNLHDQRTIFGAGSTGRPATVSFLAPAYNEAREVNEVRARAMEVIVAMNETLQAYIPNQVGRFDDSFNLNCVGDTFQYLGVPTVLFEAGHFAGDYEREATRQCIFIALVSGLLYLSENVIVSNKIDDYLKIPQNKVVFYDFVYKNVKINYDGNEKISTFAAQFKEVLTEGKVRFEARIAALDVGEDFYGHVTLDAEGALYQDGEKNVPNIEQKADFCLGKRNEIVNGLLKK